MHQSEQIMRAWWWWTWGDAGQTTTENCVGTRTHCCAMHTLPNGCWGIRDGSCSCGQSRGTFPMSLFMSHPERGGKEGEEGTDCRAPGQECCCFSWIFYWSGITEVNTLKMPKHPKWLHSKHNNTVSAQPLQPPTTHRIYNPWTGDGTCTNTGASLSFFPMKSRSWVQHPPFPNSQNLTNFCHILTPALSICNLGCQKAPLLSFQGIWCC